MIQQEDKSINIYDPVTVAPNCIKNTEHKNINKPQQNNSVKLQFPNLTKG
jgi:hypothetical protein